MPVPELLSRVDAESILTHATASDQAGVLDPALQTLLHARGWFSMLAPAAAGGAELALPAVVRLEEALAGADGSLGWTVTLCAGAGFCARDYWHTQCVRRRQRGAGRLRRA